MGILKVYESEMATVWYDVEKKMVHHKVHKFVFGEEFHKFLMAGTEAMNKYKGNKWLSDDRANTVLRNEDIEWGQTHWFPQTVKAGWKYWAIVQPEKAIAQMNMEELAGIYAKAGITAKFFTNPDEAMKWLDTCN